MVIEVIAGIDGPLAIGVVRIVTILHRTIAGKVLGYRHHAVRTELLSLEAFDNGLDQRGVQVGVLAKSSVDTVPARFGRNIGHWAQQVLDADGAQLLAAICPN